MNIFLCLICMTTISFQDLSDGVDGVFSREGQTVHIRGFPYKKNDGTIVLAAQPNLKTCCVHGPVSSQSQIVLIGVSDISLGNSAVSLEGRIHKKPLWDEKGRLIQLYTLDQVKIKTTAHSLRLWMIIPSVILGALLFFSVRKVLHSK